MAANPLQALIMHSLRMFISVHKGACADFGLTLQTTNLKFPVRTQEIDTTHACAVRNLKGTTSANKKLRRQRRFLRRQIRGLRRQIRFTSATTKSTSANKISTSASKKSTSANKASKSANKYYVSFPVYVFLLRTACHTEALKPCNCKCKNAN